VFIEDWKTKILPSLCLMFSVTFWATLRVLMSATTCLAALACRAGLRFATWREKSRFNTTVYKYGVSAAAVCAAVICSTEDSKQFILA